jgi:small subunit ribosomal protein S5
VPAEVKGKSGSAVITLKPSPQGVGLATGDVPKQVLRLAGVQDVWSHARGQTKTTINFAKATYNALKAASEMRVAAAAKERLGIKEGSVVM